MTCRLPRRLHEPQVLHLHRRAGSVRVVEIGPLDQRECPNCEVLVRPIVAPDHNDTPERPVYQCDDCLGMVSFLVRPCPERATLPAMS